MCVICVKNKGVNAPNDQTIRDMFSANHDGAGYMLWKSTQDYVKISKGYMTVESLLESLKKEKITKDDVIIYHFRWGTQGGTHPELTHPYPLVRDYNLMCELNVKADCGICHNGIIRRTSYPNAIYNDTMIFIYDYICKLVDSPKGLQLKKNQEIIHDLSNSKWASLDRTGKVVMIGEFINDKNGLWYSNMNWKRYYTEYTNGFYSRYLSKKLHDGLE